MKRSNIMFILQILYKEKEKLVYTTSTDSAQLNEVIEQLEKQRNKQIK